MSYNFQSSESRRQSMGQSSTSFGGVFSVAGLPPSGSSQLGGSTWGASTSGGSFTGSLSDPMSQSRPHYTPGYLLSASQGSATTSQRHDDAPMVQSRAKLNFPFLRNAASEFGKESMFDATEARPKLLDEDAPPTTSLNDMFNDYTRAHPSTGQPSYAKSRETRGDRPRVNQAQPLFVVVYGYPPDQYTATVEFFRSLGESPTDPDRHADITNCFRIGYSNPTEAVRAIRKNGEVIHGTYMIGVKWADVSHAESILGSPITSNYGGGVSTPILSNPTPMNLDTAMDEDTPLNPGAGALVPVSVGTPLKLVPSTAAFRQPGTSAPSAHPPAGAFTAAPNATAPPAQGKGMLGQVSDLIFGW